MRLARNDAFHHRTFHLLSPCFPKVLPVKLEELASKCGEWLRGSGPESDIVISSRVRLARNLAEFPFVRQASAEEKSQIAKLAFTEIQNIPQWKKLLYLPLRDMDELDRQFLVERQLMSREMADSEGDRGVVFDTSERFSIMVNEEDHLRIQVMCSGLDLMAAWERIDQIDDLLESRLTYAFHDDLGYLTACPTNVGTGVRISVMLHLPALVITREIEKVFRSLQKINVAVRGLYGEGSQFMGDFYQVSNQITLGRTETELVDAVGQVVPRIIEYERRARDFLVNESEQDLHDDVSRAYGILCTAKKISSEETLHYLSKVRMGVNLGLIRSIDVSTINKLFVHTQPAHLQKIRGQTLSVADRNIQRASYLQSHLGKNSSEDAAEAE
ncbi:MAG TPA: protein arginine kinase [Planctomycetaceae bacterium]|nr:protein arginine kinase [Planctomycetaceae bacterium]